MAEGIGKVLGQTFPIYHHRHVGMSDPYAEALSYLKEVPKMRFLKDIPKVNENESPMLVNLFTTFHKLRITCTTP